MFSNPMFYGYSYVTVPSVLVFEGGTNVYADYQLGLYGCVVKNGLKIINVKIILIHIWHIPNPTCRRWSIWLSICKSYLCPWNILIWFVKEIK